MAALVEAAIRSILTLSPEPIFEMLWCTAWGGYTMQIFVLIKRRVCALPTLDLDVAARWQCTPLQNASPLSAEHLGNSVAHHNMFFMMNVLDSILKSALLDTFATSNSTRLCSSPSALFDHLRSVNHLQRHVATSPNGGKWVPSEFV